MRLAGCSVPMPPEVGEALAARDLGLVGLVGGHLDASALPRMVSPSYAPPVSLPAR